MTKKNLKSFVKKANRMKVKQFNFLMRRRFCIHHNNKPIRNEFIEKDDT